MSDCLHNPNEGHTILMSDALAMVDAATAALRAEVERLTRENATLLTRLTDEESAHALVAGALMGNERSLTHLDRYRVERDQARVEVKRLTAELARVTPPAAAQGTGRVTQYTIGDCDNRDTVHRLIRVEYAGKGRWAVRRLGDCLSTDGEWDWEPMPSSRTDEWLARFRFDSADNAMDAARAAGGE